MGNVQGRTIGDDHGVYQRMFEVAKKHVVEQKTSGDFYDKQQLMKYVFGENKKFVYDTRKKEVIFTKKFYSNNDIWWGLKYIEYYYGDLLKKSKDAQDFLALHEKKKSYMMKQKDLLFSVK